MSIFGRYIRSMTSLPTAIVAAEVSRDLEWKRAKSALRHKSRQQVGNYKSTTLEAHPPAKALEIEPPSPEK